MRTAGHQTQCVICAASDCATSAMLREVRANRPLAWQRLIEKSSPLVYAWCRRAGIVPTDARDVMQEVFTAAWRGIGAFHHEHAGVTFPAWLRGITHKIADHFRDRSHQPHTDGRLDFRPAEEGDDLGDTNHCLCRLLNQAMDEVRNEFEPRTWQGFLQMVVADQSVDEVGTQLSMTAGAVRQAKYKVLRRLREKLRDAA